MSITNQLEEERRMLARLDDEDLAGLSTTVRDALTALPLRNAQLEAVLAKCEDLESWAEQLGAFDGNAGGISSAVDHIRRAIEEAGA